MSGTPTSRTRRLGAGAAALAVGFGSIFLVLDSPILQSAAAGLVLFLGVLAAFVIAVRAGLHRRPDFLAIWVAAAFAFAVASVVSGFFNGLTDEPYGTPAFVRLFPNLYGHPLTMVYYQYGSGPNPLDVSYIYLPLLTLVQVPGLDYRWVALAAWGLMVLLLRRNGPAVVLLGSPWSALLAGNGFNDPVPLLFLTLAFVLPAGARSRAAEVVALGLKQFANAIVVGYHLWRREWREALLAVGITAAFLVPFAVLDLSGVVCHALLLDPSPACGSGQSTGFAEGILGHLNYFVYVLWILGVLGPGYVARLRGPEYAPERARLAASHPPPPGPDGAPTVPDRWLVVLPFLRLRNRLARRSGGPPADP